MIDRDDVVEKKMFGGLCFMVSGGMCCGLTNSDFMVRVGPDGHDEALRQPHARPMDFTGRPMRGFVFVAPAGIKTDAQLERWIGRGVAYVERLAREKPKRKTAKQESARPRRRVK
jgi:TfoX/Sxy family transcriptional regulator of competence genes